MKLKFYCNSQQSDMFDNHISLFTPVDETEAGNLEILGNHKFVIGGVYQFEITGPVNIEAC